MSLPTLPIWSSPFEQNENVGSDSNEHECDIMHPLSLSLTRAKRSMHRRVTTTTILTFTLIVIFLSFMLSFYNSSFEKLQQFKQIHTLDDDIFPEDLNNSASSSSATTISLNTIPDSHPHPIHDKLSSTNSTLKNSSTLIPEIPEPPPQQQQGYEKHGVPPLNLLQTHEDYELLDEIRSLTTLRPRWPMKHPAQLDLHQFPSTFLDSILYFESFKLIYVPTFFDTTPPSTFLLRILSSFISNSANVTENDSLNHQLIASRTSSYWEKYVITHNKDVSEIKQILINPENVKFSFVRNPYDRVVSTYINTIYKPSKTFSLEYKNNLELLFHDMSIAITPDTKVPSFKQFVRSVRDNIPPKDMKLQWKTQTQLLRTDKIHYDFIGRFERYDSDLDVILEWIYKKSNIRLSSTVLNDWISNNGHASDDEKSFFKVRIGLLESLGEDDELIALIQQVYADDFYDFQYSTTIPDVEGVQFLGL